MKKTILITGASGDIGSEICRFFIKNNYKVIGTYNKNKATIEALEEERGSYLILIMLKSYLRI